MEQYKPDNFDHDNLLDSKNKLEFKLLQILHNFGLKMFVNKVDDCVHRMQTEGKPIIFYCLKHMIAVRMASPGN